VERPPSLFLHPSLRRNNHASQLRRDLGAAARRVLVDGGFTCPNRDGTAGTVGCLFCVDDAFTPAALDGSLPVAEQVRRALGARRDGPPVLVCFQRFTGTYGDPERVASLWREAYGAHPRVAGVVASTRPDCLPEETLAALEEAAAGRYACLEIGLQSVSDAVLAACGRGHSAADFARAAAAAKRRGFRVAAHLIHGLPGDDAAGFVAAAPWLSALAVDGVKIHHFHVVRGSGYEAPWREGRISVPSFGEHAEACVEFLLRLRPETAVLRLCGEAPERLLLAPAWPEGGARELSAAVTERLARLGRWQGDLWNGDGKGEGTA
jgi:radical SAM protein (TIGR01212 family)